MAESSVYSGRIRWSEDMEDLLVDWWQRYECLYNVSSDTYHNKAQKERCWEEISTALDLPVEEVKMRAATLRTQYSRLLKPLRTGRRMKALTARQKKILLSLNFLRKHVVPRNESNLNQSPTEMPSSQQDGDDSELENTACSLDLDSSRSRSPAENASSVRTDWTTSKESQLLELWQQHECLYNLTADNFHNKMAKDKKWAEIAAALEISVKEVKLKATSLRTQYSRLVKPQASGKKKPMTVRQKKILASCEFLRNHITHRSPESSLDQSIKVALRTQLDSSDSELENEDLPQDVDGVASPSPTESSSVSPPPPPPRLAKKRPGPQNGDDTERQKVLLLQHMLDVIQETSREPERDCEDSFGVTVAMELKRIQNPTLRNRVKRQIMTILYDALDSEQATDPIYPREESHAITVVIP